MYKYEIKDIKLQKHEALKMIIKDFVSIYIKLSIGYPNLEKEQFIIKYLLLQYIKYDNNELEVLDYINKKYGYIEDNDIIDSLLYEFDDIYEEYYKYIDNCISCYENIVNYDLITLIINRLNSRYNNEIFELEFPKKGRCFNDKYKAKVLKKLRSM